MRAQIINRFGGPEVFEPAELATPVADPGQALVRVEAASVNPVDYKIRETGLGIAPDFPAVLGADMAGTVVATGAGFDAFAPGDTVYGAVGGVHGLGGTYAEFVAADARLVAKRPSSLGAREAAALPLVSITAWEALARAGAAAGHDVLVRGGTGGVGHVAIQLARARGASVAATVSSDAKAAEVRELGAGPVVGHDRAAIQASVAHATDGSGFDVVVDTAGDGDLEPAFTAAKLNGHVATTAALIEADLTTAHLKGLSLHVVFMLIPLLHDVGREAHGRLLADAASLVDRGGLRPLVDPTRFTLDQLADAHRHAQSGRALGKVVIDVAG